MPPATTWKPRRPVNIAKSGSPKGQGVDAWVSRCQTMSVALLPSSMVVRIHCASNSRSKPRRDRSSVLKLSFTDQRPGRFEACRMAIALNCSSRAPSSGVKVTALG
ncbi:MAG: hypothetical protein IKE60_31055 [Reyranella sp.]|uniref:hypothetical protein n=1 Tax=Reyranella sp. TaxID=1929291 RepID=UPI0025E7FC1D|nr:hypothetical protein [Reyranella sp.]MBR2819147.1 hypothetical protein [Reyranella sp.]